jgi:hypothetical protein
VGDDSSFRLAYDEAVRALRAQADTLNGVRQRAGTVLATSLVVTAFFGGQAVARGVAPSSTGWLAVVAFFVAGALSLSVLFPTDPTYATDVEAVVALVEHASPERSPLRELALTLVREYRANRTRIARLQWTFRAGAVALLVEVLFWIVFLAQS